MCDFNQIYNLSEEIGNMIKLIQAYHGKLEISKNLIFEDKEYIKRIPSIIINTIEMSNSAKEIDVDNNNKFNIHEHLESILETLTVLNLSSEQNKVNNLSANNKKQKMIN